MVSEYSIMATNMKASLIRTKPMDKVNSNMRMVINMKVPGKMIKLRALVVMRPKMDANISESGIMIYSTEMVRKHGRIGLIMMVNTKKV